MLESWTGHEALSAAIEDRRSQLRIKLQDVARRADISVATLGRARRGEGDLTTDTKIGLEEALLWARGSVDAILAGGQPTPIASEATNRPRPRSSRHEFSAEARRRMQLMDLMQVLDFAIETAGLQSDRLAMEWIRAVRDVKAEAASFKDTQH